MAALLFSDFSAPDPRERESGLLVGKITGQYRNQDGAALGSAASSHRKSVDNFDN